MKINALALDYLPARRIGAEVGLHGILRYLAQQGHDVTVHTTQANRPEYTHEGVKVAPRGPGSREPADLLIAQAGLCHRLRLKAKTQRIPLVAVVHNSRLETLTDVTHNNVALAIVNSHAMDSLFGQVLPDTPTIVVHPPVFPDEWVQSHGDYITLVNLTPDKGAGTFYALAEALPNRKFLAVTGGYWTQDHRALPNVEILDHPADMHDVLARTCVLLMPSKHESWGMVAVEAMACGVAVVATDLPGPKEAIGQGGILVHRNAALDAWSAAVQIAATGCLAAQAKTRASQLDPLPQLEALTSTLEGLASVRAVA